MVYCGSYAFLKEKITEIVKEIQTSSPEKKLTFIVHTNKMKTFLKEYLTKNIGILVNANFYTLIDIAKEVSNIEPLQDFQKKLIVKSFLLEKNIDFDSLSDEISDIIQLLKESKIDYKSVNNGFVKEIIDNYKNFLKINGYYDREDVYNLAIKTDKQLNFGFVFVFGFKAITPLHMDFLKKLKDCSKEIHFFYPVIKDSGIYNNFNHLQTIIRFLEDLSKPVEFQKTTGKNTKLAKSILNPTFKEDNINPDLEILSFTDVYQEIEHIANQISNLLITGTKPHQIGIVIPDLSKYVSYIKEIFPKYKIPYNLTEEKRYIDNPIYKKLLHIFKLKERNFDKTSLLNVLSKKLFDIKNIENLEETIILSGVYKGFNDVERFILSQNNPDETFYKLLTFINNIPDKAKFQDYTNILKQLNEDFIKDQNVKNFLDKTIQELSQSELYQKLFKDLTYKKIIEILKEFLYQEDKEKRTKGNLVNILNPISAEANNFDYLYFLNLNSGKYPSIPKEETLINSSKLTGSSFPEHIIMYEILTFTNLLDDNKKITITYLSNDQNSPSFLLQEIRRLTNKTNQTNKIDTKPNTLKDFKVKYAKHIKDFDEELNEKFQNITKKQNYIIENIDIQKLKPISQQDFSVYIQCPYRFFLEKIVKVEPVEEPDRKTIPTTEKNLKIQKMIEKSSKKELTKEKFFQEFEENLKHILPSYRPFEERKLEDSFQKLLRCLETKEKVLQKREITIESLEKLYEGETFKVKIDRIYKNRQGNYSIYIFECEDSEDKENYYIKYLHLVISAVGLQKQENKTVKTIEIVKINERQTYIEIENMKEEFKKVLSNFENKNFTPIRLKDLDSEKFNLNLNKNSKYNCKDCPFESFCLENTQGEESA